MPLLLSRSGSTHRESHRMMQHLNLQQHRHLHVARGGSPVVVTQRLALQRTRRRQAQASWVPVRARLQAWACLQIGDTTRRHTQGPTW